MKILLIDEDHSQHIVRELKKYHVVKAVSTIEQVHNCARLNEGLENFDFIIMDTYLDPFPLYSHDQISSFEDVGWFLYKDLMKNLSHPKIIILVRSLEDQHRHTWGDNVISVQWKREYLDSYLPLLEKTPNSG